MNLDPLPASEGCPSFAGHYGAHHSNCKQRNEFPPYSHVKQEGLSKREWFAGMAMMGLCADRVAKLGDIPGIAVDLADRLMRELAKEPEP